MAAVWATKKATAWVEAEAKADEAKAKADKAKATWKEMLEAEAEAIAPES